MRSATTLSVVIAALLAAGCAENRPPVPPPLPPPVTAEKVLDVPGIWPIATAVALSRDGSLVAVGDVNGEIVTRELPSGAERSRRRPPGAGRVDVLAFSPDGSLLAAISEERFVMVRQLSTGFDAGAEGGGETRAIAFHPTEITVAWAAGPNLFFLSPGSGKSRDGVPNAHSGERIDSVAFSPNGQYLATVSDQGSLKLWAWPALTLRTSVAMSKSREAMAPVSLVFGRQGTRAAANTLGGRVHVVDLVKEREERVFANTPRSPGHGMHREIRGSLAFTEDGDWLFAPDMHDRGLRIIHVPSGQAYPVFRGDGPSYRAMSISVPASLVALLRPGDEQGREPYALEVWRLIYRTP